MEDSVVPSESTVTVNVVESELVQVSFLFPVIPMSYHKVSYISKGNIPMYNSIRNIRS